MTSRSAQKEDQLLRILDAASKRLRREGLAGAAIAPVMADSGLTHGAFYSYFANKDELAAAAFRHALALNRWRWVGKGADPSWPARLARLAGRYLTAAHRDDLSACCALGGLVSDAGRSGPEFRAVFEAEMAETLKAIGDVPYLADMAKERRDDDAIAFLAMIVGGIALSRAVASRDFSDSILAACERAAPRLAHVPDGAGRGLASGFAAITDFPLHCRERLRPADADAFGHVTGSALAALLEAGRAEMLFGLADDGAMLITTGLSIDCRAPILWPGTVEIATRVDSVKQEGFSLEQGVFQDGRLVGAASVAIAQTETDGWRSRPLSDGVRVRLETWMTGNGRGA